MFEFITNTFAEHPDQVVDVLEWATFCSGLIVGTVIALCSIGFILLFDIWYSWYHDRKLKKSGKLTTEQRFELLESKIDSIADIVISTSPEVK